jgi:hypothetical protein
MNKWKIIGAIAALLIAGLVALTVAVKSQHRGVITAASRSIASDLIAATNSSHLVHMSPFLRARGSPGYWARRVTLPACLWEMRRRPLETAARAAGWCSRTMPGSAW